MPDRAWVDRLREGLPQLPADQRRRWGSEHGIGFEDAEVLCETAKLAEYYEAVAAQADLKAAANWIRGELRAQLREVLSFVRAQREIP
ncbi:MAG TPA: hypothetical protein PKE32_06950, partial [Miltoncostaeaceae bacterium]|nr:hypothetical protein [Miltoncostaeaceae bacterium]